MVLMKTRSAKSKGRRLQNLLVQRLLETFPHFKPADLRPALMSEGGMDVKLSTAARSNIPYAFEAKNREAINMWESIKQAEANANQENLTPAVVISRNRLPEPYVAVPLKVFLRLIYSEWLHQKVCGTVRCTDVDTTLCPQN